MYDIVLDYAQPARAVSCSRFVYAYFVQTVEIQFQLATE